MLCNFVQLNFDNVVKHLNDHHGCIDDGKEFVQPHIAAFREPDKEVIQKSSIFIENDVEEQMETMFFGFDEDSD